MRTICLFSILLLLAACGERHNPVVASASAPKALSESGGSRFLSKGRSHSLLERLYEEELEKDSSLKRLENDLQELWKRRGDSVAAAQQFIAVNNEYYSDAGAVAKDIRDSALRLRILGRLDASLAAFGGQKAELENLLASVEKNSQSVADLHKALRIVVTLRLMERFQKTDRPSAQPIRHYKAEQDRLAQQLRDSLNRE